MVPPAPSPRRAVIPLSTLSLLVSLIWIPLPSAAQERGYGQTLGPSEWPQQRDAFQDGPAGGESILDATNPLELMNRLRRANSLNDATSPSSAIDQALRDFEAQTEPSSPAGSPSSSGPTRLIQAP